jgi:hypothetical protein
MQLDGHALVDLCPQRSPMRSSKTVFVEGRPFAHRGRISHSWFTEILSSVCAKPFSPLQHKKYDPNLTEHHGQSVGLQ